MSKKDEYNFGGIVSNDARNRMQNTPGDGMAPVAPVMAPKIEKPVGLGNQGNSTDAYVDPYNEDIAPILTGGGMYKEGGKVKKSKEEMDREYHAKRNAQQLQQTVEATKDKITIYKKGKNVTKRDDAMLSPVQKRALTKELKAELKGELKNKPYKRKYTKKQKTQPKYFHEAKSSSEKDIKKYTAHEGKAGVKLKDAQYSTKGGSLVKKDGKKYKLSPKYKSGGKIDNNKVDTSDMLGQMEGKIYKMKKGGNVPKHIDDFFKKRADTKKGLKKGKGLKNTKPSLKSLNTKGKPKKIRKPEAGQNKFTGKKYKQPIRRGLTREEAVEKGKKNIFRRNKSKSK